MTIRCNLMGQPNTTKSSSTQPNQAQHNQIKPNTTKLIERHCQNASPFFFVCKKSIFISFSNLSFELLRDPPPSQRSTWNSGVIRETPPTPKLSAESHDLWDTPALQSPVSRTSFQDQSPASSLPSPEPASRTSLQPPEPAPGWVEAQSRREVGTTLKSRLTRGRPGARQC